VSKEVRILSSSWSVCRSVFATGAVAMVPPDEAGARRIIGEKESIPEGFRNQSKSDVGFGISPLAARA
jgi:hypothetical protein